MNWYKIGKEMQYYAKSLQSCPTLCDPIDGSPPGFLIPEILQARTLEWVAIPFSRKWRRNYIKAIYCHPAYLTYVQSTSWKVTCWKNLKRETKLISYVLEHNFRIRELWFESWFHGLQLNDLRHVIGEGNGNPLQCSCLENLRDGGAWWAAIYGVTQSQTRLKWLSSSSKPFSLKTNSSPSLVFPHNIYLLKILSHLFCRTSHI